MQFNVLHKRLTPPGGRGEAELLHALVQEHEHNQ